MTAVTTTFDQWEKQYIEGEWSLKEFTTLRWMSMQTKTKPFPFLKS